MRLLVSLLLSFASVLCQQADINPLLVVDSNLHGPGVIARVTPTGTRYVAAIVASAFTVHFSDLHPKNLKTDRQLSSLPTVTMRKLKLETLQLDRDRVKTSTDDGFVTMTAHNISISCSSTLNGELRGSKLSESINFRSASLKLTTKVRINRNANGNPFLKLEDCSVHSGGIKLATKPMDPRNGKTLADAIANDAALIFNGMICPKIEHIINNRVNQRFSLLPAKISLDDSKHFDIVKIVAQAEERMKRQQVTRRRISTRRGKREDKFNILSSFNFTRADRLMLDYAMLSTPSVNQRGIELLTSGEVFETGHTTPFGARSVALPVSPSNAMLQVVVSDYVPNSLMYHGHRIRLFDTRVDWKTPQFGSVMRTTCDINTGSIFCIGDLFPALRDMLPDRNVAFLFSTLKAPAVIVRPEDQGGIHFNLLGLIKVISDRNEPIGEMEIKIEAVMKMKLTSKSVKGKVVIEGIKFVCFFLIFEGHQSFEVKRILRQSVDYDYSYLTSRTPKILLQEELDDAGFLSREILQRMVNDILKQGIPIPIHPLFKIVKPKLTLLNRSMLLETNFVLNEHIISQLTAEHLVA